MTIGPEPVVTNKLIKENSRCQYPDSNTHVVDQVRLPSFQDSRTSKIFNLIRKTIRNHWNFCRCAVMTNFFALISSFWSSFFSRPGQDNRPLSVKSDGCGKTQTKMTPCYGLRTVPRHESTVFCG